MFMRDRILDKNKAWTEEQREVFRLDLDLEVFNAIKDFTIGFSRYLQNPQ